MAATSPTLSSRLSVWRGSVKDFSALANTHDLAEIVDDAGMSISLFFEHDDEHVIRDVTGIVVIEEERDTNFLEKVQICVDNDRLYIAEIKRKSGCVVIEVESDDSL